MIEDIKYSDKELAIFEGLIDLIRSGANPYTIKVSDIAKAADIGKGTVYDYFKSKEEAISKAIIYNMNKDLKESFLRIDSKNTFKDKFYEILEIIVDNLGENLCTLKMLLSAGGIEKFYEYLIDEKYDLYESKKYIKKEIHKLLELGFNEGIIKSDESSYYQFMAIQGTILGFSHYIGAKDLYEGINLEEAKDTAYRLLIKSLN